MKFLLTIPTFLLALSISAQELFVPANAEIYISPGATLSTGNNLENQGTITVGDEGDSGNETVQSALNVEGGLQNTGTLHISEGDSLYNTGGVVNASLFENNGTMALRGNFINTSIFNTNMGTIAFIGSENQTITESYLTISSINLQKNNPQAMVTLDTDSTSLTGKITFGTGALQIKDAGLFIVEDGASITHEELSDSYFNGEIISRGTGSRIFPVGDNGYYGILEFVELTGSNQPQEVEVGVSLTHQPTDPPRPEKFVFGVSEENVWKVTHRSGSIDSVLVGIEFINERLREFLIENEFQSDLESPVIVLADSISGTFYSIGIDSSLTSSQDIIGFPEGDTYGEGYIIAAQRFHLPRDSSRYLAIGLAPYISERLSVYVPNVFSPNAFDPLNQSLRVFGENIHEENFRFEVFNRFSVRIYETKSFDEANNVGWNGVNPNGSEATTGVYYVILQYVNPEGKTVQLKQPVLLQR